MNLKHIKKPVFSLIKVVSTLLITGAIGLEGWNLYAMLAHLAVPSFLTPVFWLERFAITAHLIEGIIAAFLAPARQKTPIRYAAYTFFVGTVGLLELFDQED